ncbi:PDZ and LIM domain protein 5-like isoform X2 [Chrysoperla carnea]|uniref:PDZ and LIM domain protein 5-like isoform X2 n=1 Tax=Chrysoperla carnea TaxID=189513 RepID=UPI001D065DB5|nr:PDZ and LIM domain protein 5-like isoform X2 [Chrysoperla carnea]
MAVEIKLTKFDSTPWGFRLVGGADFDTPLTVIKVTEGSLAEEAGMRVGDTVVRVNDVPTAPLSHAQAHELIKLSGNNFTLGVFRGAVGEAVPEPKLLPVAPIGPPLPESVLSQQPEEVPVPGDPPVLEIAVPPGEALPEDLEIEQIQQSFEKQQANDLKDFAQRFEQSMSEQQVEQKVEQKFEQKVEKKSVEVKQQHKETRSSSSLSVAPPRGGRSPSPARAVRLEYSVKIEKEVKKEDDTKWSSFLQKPKGPKPIPKEELIKPKVLYRPYFRDNIFYEVVCQRDPPYKVAIQKIKRRLSKDWVEDKGVNGLNANAEVTTNETKKEEIETKTETTEQQASVEETSIQESSAVQETQIQQESVESAVSEISASETSISSHQQASVESTSIVSQTQQVSQASLLEVQKFLQTTQTSESVSGSNLSMEEQLLLVQRQLLALSQLPAAIQQTLNAVTNQLSKIVKTDESANENTTDENNNNQNEDGNQEEANLEEGENKEGDETNKGEGGDADNVEGDGDNIPQIVEETGSEELKTDATPGSTPVPPTPSPEPVDNLTPEEREKLDKKYKEEQEDQQPSIKLTYKKPMFPSTPLQRPIVLPGGKKLYEPDDIVPRKINARKYTDEVIAETISSQSEIIIGTTLGINFLKYKPEPPKSLDHLKHSEVYKMVHSLDLPTRGIAGRPSLVLAEEDLRSSLPNNGGENIPLQTAPNLPAQMEP